MAGKRVLTVSERVPHSVLAALEWLISQIDLSYDNKNDEVEKLNERVEVLNDRIDDRDAEIADLKSEIEELESTVKTLRDEVTAGEHGL